MPMSLGFRTGQCQSSCDEGDDGNAVGEEPILHASHERAVLGMPSALEGGL